MFILFIIESWNTLEETIQLYLQRDFTAKQLIQQCPISFGYINCLGNNGISQKAYDTWLMHFGYLLCTTKENL